MHCFGVFWRFRQQHTNSSTCATRTENNSKKRLRSDKSTCSDREGQRQHVDAVSARWCALVDVTTASELEVNCGHRLKTSLQLMIDSIQISALLDISAGSTQSLHARFGPVWLLLSKPAHTHTHTHRLGAGITL